MQSITLAKLAIIRGSVLFRKFNDIDHPKFFVVIGENSDHFIGFFFINSNIHPSIKEKPLQFEMQMMIRKKNYEFLDYDSFISANRIERLDKNMIASEIVSRETKIKGMLTGEDLDMLMTSIRKSPLFSKIEKDSFFK
ncbi:MAG: hypothetical protein LBE91_18955 [Tannerella sp.]|jgi:hypothetical protein|nr:hypothetical protein [Tannerella sp.]